MWFLLMYWVFTYKQNWMQGWHYGRRAGMKLNIYDMADDVTWSIEVKIAELSRNIHLYSNFSRWSWETEFTQRALNTKNKHLQIRKIRIPHQI